MILVIQRRMEPGRGEEGVGAVGEVGFQLWTEAQESALASLLRVAPVRGLKE